MIGISNKNLLLCFFKYFLIACIFYFTISKIIEKIPKIFSIGINLTASEKTGIYFGISKFFTLKIGDLVSFNAPDKKWIIKRNYVSSETLILKSIAAAYPKWLYTKAKSIYSCDYPIYSKNCTWLGTCLSYDRNYRSLPCQQWKGYQIPKDSFYMQSTKILNSLDSRYFGLINKNAIKYKQKLIFS